MGTQIVCLYGSIPRDCVDAAARLADLFETEYGGELLSEFANVRISSRSGFFQIHGEVNDLNGRADLDARLGADGSGAFSYELDLEFAPTEARIVLFERTVENFAQSGRPETGVAIIFEKELTTYLFTSDVTHAPFATVLERIARALDAPCYIAGTEYDRWRHISPGDLEKPEVFGKSPQVVGWRDGALDAAALMNALGAAPEWLEKSLGGYCYVSLLGRLQMRHGKGAGR